MTTRYAKVPVNVYWCEVDGRRIWCANTDNTHHYHPDIKVGTGSTEEEAFADLLSKSGYEEAKLEPKRYRLELRSIEKEPVVIDGGEYTAQELDGIILLRVPDSRTADRLAASLKVVKPGKPWLILTGEHEVEAYAVELPKEMEGIE